MIRTTDSRPDLLVICGPTASGKTALAVTLARHLQGEILSADSRQVYRGLDIGSGKDLIEYGAGGCSVPYHLIDIADPRDIFTLYHFQKHCYRSIREVRRHHHLPIICGGSGLYIESVLRTYRIPAVAEDAPLRRNLMEQTKADCTTMLRNLDPDLCRSTDLSSKKRVVRAIEVALYRNTGPSTEPQQPPPPITPLILCARWQRPCLHERIAARLEARFQEGMIEEVVKLRDAGVPDERLLMLGMEYKFITMHLRGELDGNTMVEQLRRSIFLLAKRQETWFRGMERRGFTVHWIENADSAAALSIVEDLFPERFDR